MNYALRQKRARLLIAAEPISQSKFGRGKHEGETLEQVAEKDMAYLEFLAEDRDNNNLYVMYDVREFLATIQGE